MVPRDLSTAKEPATHNIYIAIPVQAIKQMKNTDGPNLKHGLQTGEGFIDREGTPEQLATIEVTTGLVLISGSMIPALATKKLDSQIEKLMASLRQRRLVKPFSERIWREHRYGTSVYKGMEL
jgi:hypothetical protein